MKYQQALADYRRAKSLADYEASLVALVFSVDDLALETGELDIPDELIDSAGFVTETAGNHETLLEDMLYGALIDVGDVGLWVHNVVESWRSLANGDVSPAEWDVIVDSCVLLDDSRSMGRYLLPPGWDVRKDLEAPKPDLRLVP